MTTPQKHLFTVELLLPSTVVVFAEKEEEAMALAKKYGFESLLSSDPAAITVKDIRPLTKTSQMVGTGWGSDCLPFRSDDGEQTIGQIMATRSSLT